MNMDGQQFAAEMDWARNVARQVCRDSRWLPDVESAALEALWTSAERYNPDGKPEGVVGGVPTFHHFAFVRIRGAALDTLRTINHSRYKNAALLAPVYIEDVAVLDDDDFDIPAPEIEEDEQLDTVRELARKEFAAGRLDERELGIVEDMLHGDRYVVSAARLGISESRVTQIAIAARKQLASAALATGLIEEMPNDVQKSCRRRMLPEKCCHDHLLTNENVYWTPSGKWHCRKCSVDSTIKSRAKKAQKEQNDRK
jgi:RNA polymerase sigma factor (sigma-70 family)